MRDHSAELEMLMRIFDRLGEVIQATVAVQGGKPPRIAPLPRPTTALERLRTKERWAKHRRTVARMLPHRSAQPETTARPRLPTGASQRPSAGVRVEPGYTPWTSPGREP